MVTAYRYASWVNLCVARVGESRPLFVCPVGCCYVTAHGVGGQVKDISVTAGGKDNGICRMTLYLAGNKISDNDTFGNIVRDNDVEHF